MKVLLINGSPNEHGCTRFALDEAARVLNGCGVETELLNVGREASGGCIACGACYKTGRCVRGGGVNEAIEALNSADGLIVGSPVHYASPAGGLLAFLDRMFYAGASGFAHKPAACIVSAPPGGHHRVRGRDKQVLHHQPDAGRVLHLLADGPRQHARGGGAGCRGPSDRAQPRAQHGVAD